VVLDDSIVRGTTLEKSIIKMLDKLEPKKIIIVSCAPQIRYPDCYGIDMSRLKEFVAFRALLALLKDSGQEDKLKAAYQSCVATVGTPAIMEKNYLKEIYDLFSADEISAKVSEIVKAADVHAEVQVIYQRI